SWSSLSVQAPVAVTCRRTGPGRVEIALAPAGQAASISADGSAVERTTIRPVVQADRRRPWIPPGAHVVAPRGWVPVPCRTCTVCHHATDRNDVRGAGALLIATANGLRLVATGAAAGIADPNTRSRNDHTLLPSSAANTNGTTPNQPSTRERLRS